MSRPEQPTKRITSSQFRVRLRARHLTGTLFVALAMIGTTIGVVLLAVLLFEVARDGVRFLSLDFLNSFPSRKPELAGFKSALWGSIWLITFTALWAFPLGVGAAIYLD